MAAFENVHFLFEHLNARVFYVHGGDNRDAQFFFYCFADGAAGYAVTACLECRAGKEEVDLFAFQHFHNAGNSFLGIGTHEVIAADDGMSDFSVDFFRELHSRANVTFVDDRFHTGFFFAADLTEELVDI